MQGFPERFMVEAFCMPEIKTASITRKYSILLKYNIGLTACPQSVLQGGGKLYVMPICHEFNILSAWCIPQCDWIRIWLLYDTYTTKSTHHRTTNTGDKRLLQQDVHHSHTLCIWGRCDYTWDIRPAIISCSKSFLPNNTINLTNCQLKNSPVDWAPQNAKNAATTSFANSHSPSWNVLHTNPFSSSPAWDFCAENCSQMYRFFLHCWETKVSKCYSPNSKLLIDDLSQATAIEEEQYSIFVASIVQSCFFLKQEAGNKWHDNNLSFKLTGKQLTVIDDISWRQHNAVVTNLWFWVSCFSSWCLEKSI